VKTLLALSLLLVSVGASAQSYQHLPPHERPPGSEKFDQPQYERHDRDYGRREQRGSNEVPPRFVERPGGPRAKGNKGRDCARSGYDRAGNLVCFEWVERNSRR
jgi:hypothetical protein